MDIEWVNVKATLNYKVKNVCQQTQMRNCAPDTKTSATTWRMGFISSSSNGFGTFEVEHHRLLCLAISLRNSFFGFKVILGKGERSFHLYLEEAFHILQQIDPTITAVILFRHSRTQVNHCWFIEFSMRFSFSFPFRFKVPTKESKQIKYLRSNSQDQCILEYYSILFQSWRKS